MPKMKKATERAKAETLTNLYIKKGRNKAAVGRQEGVSRQAIHSRMKLKPVQETLDKHIQKVAKRVGINLDWLLRKYKKGADQAGEIVKLVRQDKKGKDVTIDLHKPDWNTQRLYLRDVAEIMKWIKQNSNNNDKGTHIHFHLTVKEQNARINRLSEFYKGQSQN